MKNSRKKYFLFYLFLSSTLYVSAQPPCGGWSAGSYYTTAQTFTTATPLTNKKVYSSISVTTSATSITNSTIVAKNFIKLTTGFKATSGTTTKVQVGINNCPTATVIAKEDEQKEKENSNLPNILLYPNPTNAILNIEFENCNYTSYIIHGADGRLLKQGMISTNEKLIMLDISEFSAGFYSVTFNNQQSELKSLNFIKL